MLYILSASAPLDKGWNLDLDIISKNICEDKYSRFRYVSLFKDFSLNMLLRETNPKKFYSLPLEMWKLITFSEVLDYQRQDKLFNVMRQFSPLPFVCYFYRKLSSDRLKAI